MAAINISDRAADNPNPFEKTPEGLPVTVSVEQFLLLAAVIAAAVTIGASLYKIAGALRKLVRILFRMDEAIPRLLDVADNWSYNGGYTLRDKLERTESNVALIGEHLGLTVEPVKPPETNP